MDVPVAEGSRRDDRSKTGIASEVPGLRKTRQRIEFGRGIVTEVVMLRAFPLLRLNGAGDVRIAPQVPLRIEIDRSPQFGFARFDAVQVVLENAVFPDRGGVGGIEVR